MTNINKNENIANAISEAKYQVMLRKSELEVAMEQLRKEEDNILGMEESHKRYEAEFASAKESSLAADAEVKRLENAKELLGEDFTDELGKKLTAAKKAATRAMNKASKLGEELTQLEAKILALVPTKKEPKEEPKEEVKSTSVPVSTPAVKKVYPTKMKMKTNKVFTKEDGTKLVFFKKYDGSFVKYDAAIRDAASVLLPEKEYDVEGHWSSDKWTFYVDRVLDNGNQVMPVVTSIPEANAETRGSYNAMAEAFAKANAKKMA